MEKALFNRTTFTFIWKVGRLLEKLEKHLASPRATQTPLSCVPNFPRASITRQTHAKHGPFLNMNHHQQQQFIVVSLDYSTVSFDTCIQ